MAIKTLKIGDTCIVKETGFKTEILDIKNGAHTLKNLPSDFFFSGELRGVAPKPEKKKLEVIKRTSTHRKLLIIIYSTVRDAFLLNNKECQANLCGCTKIADQVHHKWGKEGLRLIMSHYFLATCWPCHRRITDYNAKAIVDGLSLPRTQKLPWIFSALETSLLKKHRIKKMPY